MAVCIHQRPEEPPLASPLQRRWASPGPPEGTHRGNFPISLRGLPDPLRGFLDPPWWISANFCDPLLTRLCPVFFLPVGTAGKSRLVIPLVVKEKRPIPPQNPDLLAILRLRDKQGGWEDGVVRRNVVL